MYDLPQLPLRRANEFRNASLIANVCFDSRDNNCSNVKRDSQLLQIWQLIKNQVDKKRNVALNPFVCIFESQIFN